MNLTLWSYMLIGRSLSIGDLKHLLSIADYHKDHHFIVLRIQT